MKVLAVSLAIFAVSCGRSPGSISPDAARTAARRHSAHSFRVLDLVASRIDDFFAARQPAIGAFSEEIFGLRGKWRALFWSREDFERHVRRRFEEHVFRPEDFDREVFEPVRGDLAFAIDASEAGLASDLDRWARAARPGVEPPDARPALSRLVAGLVLRDLGLNVASIAGSEAAVMATSALLTRAGLLGASLAAGAGTSWVTFGIGLVVGVVAGIVIDATVGDELEETARESVRLELDGLRRKLLETEGGLWRAAKRVLEAHARALEESAVKLIGESIHVARGA